MSSLWTPGGEHPVDRGPDDDPDHRHDDLDHSHDDELADLDPETERQVREEMERAQAQLASVPASVVVANHAMGCYELAAIHLSQTPPNFADASLAIDALGALVEGLVGRLGDNEGALRDALAQIRLVFVQLKNRASGS